MTLSDKRQPALTDTDPMPFGKHQGEPLQDVPARYLQWLWGQLAQDGYTRKDYEIRDSMPAHVATKIKLANYIWNSKGALELELGEEL